MARKVWNEGTPERYAIKSYKIVESQGAPAEETLAAWRAQRRAWETGAGNYRRIRDMARKVFVRPETKVDPVFRAGYYAFAQRLWKLCVVTGEADPDEVIAEFKRKSEMYDETIMSAIVDELGLGKKEIVGRVST
ncbi:MAG: hypothetical protein DRN17_07160 [Thermoplasmata archaeon]|nr:MAG: hypothetical protein DRN17_07160 [Thermoplasmata archaeon]